jgi:hypothetical protein
MFDSSRERTKIVKMFGIAKADKFSQGLEKNVNNVSSRPAKKHKNMRNRQI